ncbi:MAG: aminotransferase class I/II-fold pyridoxal phosphate-dependent enzyme [Candidatus Eisenbacteria bacterium]
MSERIYLSPPHMSGLERKYVDEAFDTNWVAPLGPNVDGFEREFAARVGSPHAAALSSGTAALHLALILSDVGPGDEVIVSSLTFVASVNPITYVGAKPILVDSEERSWNLDPERIEEAIRDRMTKTGRLPKAVLAVHLYGQSADMDAIDEICQRHGVTLIEDAAEALGTTYWGKGGGSDAAPEGPHGSSATSAPAGTRATRSPGTIGRVGVFSFNGNKIITTSGGGMLVSSDDALIQHARKLATQARDPAPHYEHTEIGYNYRMSNILAGVGRGQLAVLDERIAARRENFAYYQETLGSLPGLTFQPDAGWGMHTRWLTCVLVDPVKFGATREQVRVKLEEHNIESRPLWKPMHLQPLFQDAPMYGGAVADRLFELGLCLPSGSSLAAADRERIAGLVRDMARPA